MYDRNWEDLIKFCQWGDKGTVEKYLLTLDAPALRRLLIQKIYGYDC